MSKIVEIEGLLLAGMNFYGDPFSLKGGWDDENAIGATWKRFMTFISGHSDRPYSKGKQVFYEIHLYNDQTQVTGEFDVFVGEEVTTSKVPCALSCRWFDTKEYAVFTLKGNEIVGDWWHQIDEIVEKEFSRQIDKSYVIQRYDERFKGMDKIDDSEIDVLIPFKE